MEEIHRLSRWMLTFESPVPLDLDHPVQEDLAWAADEIVRLTCERDALADRIIRAHDELRDGATVATASLVDRVVAILDGAEEEEQQ